MTARLCAYGDLCAPAVDSKALLATAMQGGKLAEAVRELAMGRRHSGRVIARVCFPVMMRKGVAGWWTARCYSWRGFSRAAR